MEKGQSLQQMVLGKLDSHMQKNETGTFSYTIHKMDERPKCEVEIYQNPREHRQQPLWGFLGGRGGFHYFFSNFIYIQLAYSILLVSEVEFSDSSVAYNTQCSLYHMPSLMPITQLPHPPPTPPATLSLFPIVKSLSWFFSLTDDFPFSFPFPSPKVLCFVS